MPKALEAISDSLNELNYYFHTHVIQLKTVIASCVLLSTKQLIIKNGVDETTT
ncbi:hypothetical protein [Peribacillus asahii]|uniref:hypothetical protein n=1 Tax=Peribacillus asahii TaxID=228899 RepID=UPI0015FCF0D8|nr:hypothetical protein [Peribacillus asahii]